MFLEIIHGYNSFGILRKLCTAFFVTCNLKSIFFFLQNNINYGTLCCQNIGNITDVKIHY